MILVLEMFLLALWASQAYKKSEHRNLAETYITDASDATLIPRKYGTVATSTDDLHVSLFHLKLFINFILFFFANKIISICEKIRVSPW